MAQIGFTRQQYDREFYSLACRGMNRVSDWESRFGYRQQDLAIASHKFYGCKTIERFKFIQLEIAKDMVLNSNLDTHEIAELLDRNDKWLMREYLAFFGESIITTRKNKLWSQFV